jgi:hypothetical protein
MSTHYPFDPFYTHTIRKKINNLVLCCITCSSFPDDGHLRTETCTNVRCDIIQISWDKVRAFFGSLS